MTLSTQSAVTAAAFGLLLSACAMTAGAQPLTDNDGMTVYTFDRDQPGSGESACYGACADAWPPVPADEISGRGVGTLTREDGARQATYKGQPLYYFTGDSEPGQANGDGVNGVWHVVTPEKSSSGREGRSGGGYGDGY